MTTQTSESMRSTPIIRRSAPAGSSPGTLAIDPDAPHPEFHVIAYGPDGVVEQDAPSLDDVRELQESHPVVWLNVDGLGDEAELTAIAQAFGLHRLALEDVVNVPQRAKLEPYDEHLFVVVRMINEEPRIGTEQISLFIGDGYVLTLQERAGDCFEVVRDRIRRAHGRVRKSGADYLAYALIDAVIDGYYPVLEHCGEHIEALEGLLLTDPEAPVGPRIHTIKRDLLMIRRGLAPHREMLHSMIRNETEYIATDTLVYLRDCADHTIQLLDMVETYRELTSGLLDLHLAIVSNRMNEVMKVLTIFAAIFIPLGFIAGLYGMNFDPASQWNMPETKLSFGYPLVLGLMATTAGALLWYFRRKGWIGTRRPARDVDV